MGFNRLRQELDDEHARKDHQRKRAEDEAERQRQQYDRLRAEADAFGATEEIQRVSDLLFDRLASVQVELPEIAHELSPYEISTTKGWIPGSDGNLEYSAQFQPRNLPQGRRQTLYYLVFEAELNGRSVRWTVFVTVGSPDPVSFPVNEDDIIEIKRVRYGKGHITRHTVEEWLLYLRDVNRGRRGYPPMGGGILGKFIRAMSVARIRK
ncbi:MAG TPA: hypothetical protein VK689_06525 [Armatimonadota bacterium]|nr:hypothetical protein [Armatimonadota bacterium]